LTDFESQTKCIGMKALNQFGGIPFHALTFGSVPIVA
jgi:hypothetical protein